MSNAMAEPLHEIRGVEIFRVGKWNGDDYSAGDLAAMADAFHQVGFSPPLKLGHTSTDGDRAYGWVRSLRLSGEKLVADLCDVPASLYRVIRERGYDAVSAEIFWNLERNGKKFARVLKAVALLGAEPPAVSDLAPLRSRVLQTRAETMRSYTIPTRESEADPGAELAERAYTFIYEHPGTDFRRALACVMAAPANRDLVRQYNERARGSSPQANAPRNLSQKMAQDRREVIADASAEIDQLARAYSEKNPKTPFREAILRVLETRPDLRVAWARGR